MQRVLARTLQTDGQSYVATPYTVREVGVMLALGGTPLLICMLFMFFRAPNTLQV